MFNRSAYENSRPEGISTLRATVTGAAGEAAGAPFVPLRQSVLQGEITGPLAALTLVQQFGFAEPTYSKPIEAVYRFPLPGDAAVTGVHVRFGEVEIEASLAVRADAEKSYDRAKKLGRQAALATRESPDVFTLHVAGIAPGETVQVETRFVLLGRPQGSGWSLRIPLTTAPRYVREDENESRHAHGQPLAALRDPGHRFSLDLALRHVDTVESRTHALATEAVEGGVRVALVDGEVLPDRDFVLTWTCQRDETRPALHVTVHRDPADEWLYLLGLVTPPGQLGSLPPVSREILVLVDHSGSMQGAKWEAADWAVKSFLSGLTDQDTFNLGLFHSTTRWFSSAPVPATTDQVEAGIEFLEAHRDTGGTELGVALEQALQQTREEGEVARHVLIVTDAEVTDAGRILQLVASEARQSAWRRVSVICIDAAPNSLLVHEVAARGGGSAHFLTSSAEDGDITTALDELLAGWSAPVLTGLSLEVTGIGVESPNGVATKGEAGVSRLDLRDLPAASPIWITARMPAAGLDQLSLRLSSTGRPVAACRILVAASDKPAAKALFGARRILALEYLAEGSYSGPDLECELRRLGYSAASPEGQSALYPENRRAADRLAVEKILVREALEFGLASAETAFVATRTERGQPVSSTVIVGNALPAGWSAPSYGGRVASRAMLSAPAPAWVGRRDMALAISDIDCAPEERERGCYESHWFAFAGVSDNGYGSIAETTDVPQIVFEGVPAFVNGTAELYDSDEVGSLAPDGGRIRLTRIWLHMLDGGKAAVKVSQAVVVLLFVGDQTSPRARIPVQSLLRQGGRPLNLTVSYDEQVRIVLEDPAGEWVNNPPRLEIRVQ